MACKNRVESNRFNFLRWRKVNNATLSDLPISELCPIVFTLETPSDLTLVVNSKDSISLNWTDNTGGDSLSYQIFRGTQSGVLSQIAVTSNIDSYDDNTGSPDTQYYYQVRAVANGLVSGFSNEATARTIDVGIEMDGVNDEVTRNGSNIILPNNWSIEIWFKLEGVGDPIGTFRTLFRSSISSTNNLVQILVGRSAAGPFLRLQILDSTNTQVLAEDNVFTNDFLDNRIYMMGVSCEFNGGNYIYNIYGGDKTENFFENLSLNVIGLGNGKSDQINDINIGHAGSVIDRYWKGLINKFRMYTDVLDNSDFQTQFNNGQSNDPFSNNIIFRYELNENTAGVIDDLGPNNYDVTMSNFANNDDAFVDFE